MTTIVYVEPMYLDRVAAAAYLAMGVSTFEALVREEKIKPPREVSAGLVGWLLEDLKEYGRSRPVSQRLPPRNSGYGRAGKAAGGASASR